MFVFDKTAKVFGGSSVSLVASLSVAVQAMAFALPDQASAGLVPWRPTKLRIETIKKTSKSARVTINGKPVAEGDSAKLKELVQTTDKTTATARISAGEIVSATNTKAGSFFRESTDLVMRDKSSFSLGKDCVQLDSSNPGQKILLSGVGSVCFAQNTRKGNSRKTVFIVQQDLQGNYTVAVLAGTVDIDSNAETLIPEDYDINQRFPVIAPSFGVGASGFANAFPSSGGMLLATANTFVPLSQQRAASMLYSYSAVGSNFDGFAGISTELGYRWLTPSNQSSTSVYVGYSGFDSPSCFSNLVNLGAGWERRRWRLGASGGLSTGGCQAGFSFGALNLSAPIATFEKTRVAYLSLTPYLLWGDNILTAGYYDATSGSVAPGARLSLLAPITENLSLNAYGAVDTVYGATVGGMLKLRFPVGGRVIRDPNLQVAQATSAPLGGVAAPIGAVADGFEIPEAYKARFTADGGRIGGTEKIRPEEFIGFVTDYLEGIAPLAESHRVARVAAKNGALNSRVASILGSEFLETAARPVSETAQQPFDVTYFPTATYSCVATDSAKAYAEQRLRDENNIEAADRVAAASTVYLGPGDRVSRGWPVTTSQNNAYRFGNESVCREANSIIERDSRYNGPPNPVGTVILR
jgi:hypothetical protein